MDMKKSLTVALAALSTAAAFGAFSPTAYAQAACVGCSAWQFSPDGDTTAGSVTVTDAVSFFNSDDTSSQSQGMYGAGFTISGNSAFTMKFDADLNTFDSYNENTGVGTGYYDGFIVTVNTTGFYWTLPHTDPIAASATTFVWGGTNWNDGVLEQYNTTVVGNPDTISLNAGVPSTFYVSLVLDTKTTPDTDTLHPSWGSFHVNVVPEPETYAMLLAGLGLMGFVARRRQRNLAAA